MRWIENKLGPSTGGFLGLLVAVLFVGLCLWPITARFAESPSDELLRYLAAIGATLLIAYAIEASAAVRASVGRNAAQEAWVGGFVGAAAAGLVGIVLSLALSERAAVEHWMWLDDLAFALAAGSILFLGIFVVLLPRLTYDWSRLSHLDDD